MRRVTVGCSFCHVSSIEVVALANWLGDLAQLGVFNTVASLTALRSWIILYFSGSPLGVHFFTGNKGVFHSEVQGIRAPLDTRVSTCFEMAVD